MPYTDAVTDQDGVAAWFAERLSEQRAAHQGAVLRTWAEVVLRRLPQGPVALLAMSTEGCALAAVVAARRESKTSWERLSLMRPHPKGQGARVLVEPARLAPGMVEALGELLPEASIIDAVALEPALASAA